MLSERTFIERRRILCALALAAARPTLLHAAPRHAMTVYTFGDSVLDCGHYNEHGITPGQLVVRNDDALFPEFEGQDLSSRGPAILVHRAVDGSTVRDLPAQALGLTRPSGGAVAMVTVGGNDLLQGLAADDGSGVAAFAHRLERFLGALPVRAVLLANVYDPTFGDDARNFLSVPAPLARTNLRRVNEAIASLATRFGRLVDLHAHFLRGDASWFVNVIEPSWRGASEVRRAFMASL
jgi:lysophospholipase L1-like esterase